MEVTIAGITSAPRNHVIATIKTQTINSNSKYAKKKSDLVRIFIIALTRIYHLPGKGIQGFSNDFYGRNDTFHFNHQPLLSCLPDYRVIGGFTFAIWAQPFRVCGDFSFDSEILALCDTRAMLAVTECEMAALKLKYVYGHLPRQSYGAARETLEQFRTEIII
ncbi:MAG TPA: hypothetical protein VJR02_05560 [Pyrinomonadaceae bacterium]|nr:hypothetical protein [Pyrinomonadaceae bacterium]